MSDQSSFLTHFMGVHTYSSSEEMQEDNHQYGHPQKEWRSRTRTLRCYLKYFLIAYKVPSERKVNYCRAGTAPPPPPFEIMCLLYVGVF